MTLYTSIEKMKEAFCLIRRDLHSRAANKVFDEALASAPAQPKSEDEIDKIIYDSIQTILFPKERRAVIKALRDAGVLYVGEGK